MEGLSVDPDLPAPPSRQLVEAFLDRMATGVLAAGDRLPSVRDLAQLALVNPNTAAKAYRDLGFLGVVDAKNGSGVFVAAGGPDIARRERRLVTWNEFRSATRAAMRAGFTIEELRREIEASDGAARKKGS